MSFLWKKPKYKKRFAVFGMLCLVLFVSLAPSLPASAAGTLSGFSESLKKFFSGELDEVDMAEGYYGLSEAAAGAFAQAQAKGTVNELFTKDGGGVEASGVIPSCGAGSLLGFYEDGPSFDLKTIVSSYSTVEYSYSMLFGKDTEWNKSAMVFGPYVALGACLSDLGIDQTGAKSGDFGFVRYAVGGLMIISYTVSMIVPALFSIVIKALQMLNPFQFFYQTEGNLADQYAALNAEGGTADGLLRGVTDFVGSWYRVLNNMGPFVIVFFACLLTITVLLSRRARHDMSTYKRFLIRMTFIVIGIPVIGSTYNVFLSELGTMVSGNNMAAAKVVASSFCDFESFVNNGLKYNGTLTVDVTEDSVRAHKTMNPQKICFDINLASNDALQDGDWNLYDASNGEDDSTAISNMISSLQSNDTVSDILLTDWIYDMLGRYTKGDKISASAYAGKSASKMWLVNADSDQTKQAAIASFLMTYSNADGFEDAAASRYSSIFYTGGAKMTDGSGFYGSGSNKGDEKINPFRVNTSKKGPIVVPSTWNGELNISYNGNWEPNDISIYNYLRTTFTNNSLTVYSPKNASSDAVKYDHYSVNLVGSGIQSLFIFMTCLVMLATFSVIGVFYSFGIIMTNLRRGIQLILSVPLAMLGSLKAIARIITYAVVMILEVIAVIISYSLITNLIFTLTQSFNGLLGTTIGQLAGAQLLPVFSLFTTIFNIWFLILAVKLRKNVTRALDQGAEAIISKFIIGEAQHTGALNSKELTPVRQLGEKPEKTLGQKVGTATIKAGSAAVSGVMAAGMIASGNIPGGIANAVNAVKGAKGAAKDLEGDQAEGEGLKEYPADEPGRSGGSIERKGVGMLTDKSGKPFEDPHSGNNHDDGPPSGSGGVPAGPKDPPGGGNNDGPARQRRISDESGGSRPPSGAGGTANVYKPNPPQLAGNGQDGKAGSAGQGGSAAAGIILQNAGGAGSNASGIKGPATAAGYGAGGAPIVTNVTETGGGTAGSFAPNTPPGEASAPSKNVQVNVQKMAGGPQQGAASVASGVQGGEETVTETAEVVIEAQEGSFKEIKSEPETPSRPVGRFGKRKPKKPEK